MNRQALLGRQLLLRELRDVHVDLGQVLDDAAGALGELLGDVAHLTAPVGQAVGNDGGELACDVGCQRVAHLHGRLQFFGPMVCQSINQVESLGGSDRGNPSKPLQSKVR